MFEGLMNLFGNTNSEASVAAEKFKRYRQVCASKAPAVSNEEIAAPTASKILLDHWTSRTQVQEPTPLTDEYAPMVTYPPESLLEPGTAEGFQSCKLNPVDEFKQKRDGRLREDTLSGGIVKMKLRKSA